MTCICVIWIRQFNWRSRQLNFMPCEPTFGVLEPSSPYFNKKKQHQHNNSITMPLIGNVQPLRVTSWLYPQMEFGSWCRLFTRHKGLQLHASSACGVWGVRCHRSTPWTMFPFVTQSSTTWLFVHKWHLAFTCSWISSFYTLNQKNLLSQVSECATLNFTV